MNSKSKVQNPLTIIAIFAGIAELAGTTVLLGLPLEIQKIFVWFVMLFPIGLVAAFFLVLLFKHKVLYAPSDFVDENNFMNLLQNKKVQHEILEVVDLLEQIKESNTANEQLKQTLSQAMFKLENAKQNNEHNFNQFSKYITTSREDNNYENHATIRTSIVEIIKNAGKEGISRKQVAYELGRSEGYISHLVRLLVEAKIIRLEDDIFYYNIK
ncbi:hypothetical protein [Paenibacillus illinoisensis]|uniref:hypothetical protein n=1 Tax=Paenibacillus illinoisensis TaxID=59845 RepID=UPI00203AE3D5|nr:hypothetical protein [Paenibacillus illinoisensis]MCM3206407.1 hypothetical protein [Paenibacillus illinoisensis]